MIVSSFEIMKNQVYLENIKNLTLLIFIISKVTVLYLNIQRVFLNLN